MKGLSTIEALLQSFRQEFDASFAEPLVQAAQARQTLLKLRVAGTSYAVRIGELAGLLGCRKLVRLPGAPPALAGLVGIRGRLVGAFDLAQLLGHPPRTASFRWLLLCPGSEPIALGVEVLDGYLEVVEEEFLPIAAPSSHAGWLLRQGGSSLPVLQIPSLVAAIQSLSQTSGHSPKEP